MSDVLLNDDLANIALDIERKGAAFYDVMARSSDEAKVRETFRYLAGMERRHLQIFQDIFSVIDGNMPITHDGERSAYMKALVDNSVFTDEFVNSEQVNRIKSDIQALELSIIAEKDSVILYYELRDQMEEPNRELINRILIEEKTHIRQLSEIKREMMAGDKKDRRKENPGGRSNGGATDSP